MFPIQSHYVTLGLITYSKCNQYSGASYLIILCYSDSVHRLHLVKWIQVKLYISSWYSLVDLLFTYFDLLCTICKRKGRNREAEKYCIECNDSYCLTCVKVHDEVPLLSGHNILDEGQFKSSQGPSSTQTDTRLQKKFSAAPTERCDKHNHYFIDMYCQNHDEVGCATCMAVYHRTRSDTFYIPEFLQNNADTSTLSTKRTQNILDELTKILSKQQDKLQYQKQTLLKAKAESLQNITKFRKEINERLDILEKNSTEEVESTFQALITEIEKAYKTVTSNKTNIRSAQDKLLFPGNSASQVFVNIKKGNQSAKVTSECTGEEKTQTSVVDIEFNASQKLQGLLQEMDTLGTINQKNAENQENAVCSINPSMYPHSTSPQNTQSREFSFTSDVRQRNVLLRATRKKTYSVEEKSDTRKCAIVCACAMDNGTIILSDCKNKKLKRLDSSTFTVTDCLDLPSWPWQVCPVGAQEEAVCLMGEQIVKFVLVDGRMTETKQIKTDFNCYCLAYSNGYMYISDDSASLYMYTLSGSKVKELTPYQLERKLFSDIRSLAVSQNGSKIYVCDSKKGLFILDRSGQVIGQF